MPENSLLRTFFAISTPCPPSLARVLKEFGQLGSAVKTLSPRGLHCTLRFLGGTSPETAVRLGPAIITAMADIPRFSAELSGLGAFPNADRPAVIWAGMQAAEFDVLFERVEALATEFGYQPERRPHQPHVTLARVKHRPPGRLAEIMQQHALTQWGTVEVAAVEFFKSTLTPAGPHYEVLATAGLRR